LNSENSHLLSPPPALGGSSTFHLRSNAPKVVSLYLEHVGEKYYISDSGSTSLPGVAVIVKLST